MLNFSSHGRPGGSQTCRTRRIIRHNASGPWPLLLAGIRQAPRPATPERGVAPWRTVRSSSLTAAATRRSSAGVMPSRSSTRMVAERSIPVHSAAPAWTSAEAQAVGPMPWFQRESGMAAGSERAGPPRAGQTGVTATGARDLHAERAWRRLPDFAKHTGSAHPGGSRCPGRSIASRPAVAEAVRRFRAEFDQRTRGLCTLVTPRPDVPPRAGQAPGGISTTWASGSVRSNPCLAFR